MDAKRICIGLGILAAGCASMRAQTPVLGSIEAPYGNVQNTVQVAGHTWGPGAVAYGPVGTPLVLSGSDLGDAGTVRFIAYKNGSPDPNVAPIIASPSLWNATMIFVPVPSGALTGTVQVQVEGKTSNSLPFIVMSGTYSGSCPAGPNQSQLQIVTTSLNNGSVNQSYSATLSATGGTQPYTWTTVPTGSLPSGLSLSSAGAISGTPTATVSQDGITFEVTDSSSPRQSNQVVLDLTIDAQQMTPQTVYQYTASYDADGNVTQNTDTVMGNWGFTYDAFNRLQSGTATSGGNVSQDYAGQNLCWAYDSYGNRTVESIQTAACPSLESNLSSATWANNQIPGGLVGYDAAGNITSDANSGNSYVYDAEGRVCAVKNAAIPGMPTYTGYLYDAEGNRVAKGTISTMSCDPTTNGFQITESYVLGPSGEELSMLNGSNWQRTNVFAGGKLVGTYDANGLHFHLEDPLGTRRMQLSGNPNYLGVPDTDIQSLPYGDRLYSFPDQYATAGADDATPLHFTGKERDTESGNDYFGARYYASTMGRFMSPDWSAKAEPVPYAKLDDPQSLNLYDYVRNNPLSRVDVDGHYDAINQTVSACNHNASCIKNGLKAVVRGEKARLKDLKSKDANVRAGAAAFGALGENNGVHVTYTNLAGQGINGSVDPSGSSFGTANIQVQIDSNRSSGGMQETFAHEGTHVADDFKFLNSFNPMTMGYDQTLNPTHFQTEFNAFKAGAGVNHEHGFGPNDNQGITDYIRANYPARTLPMPVFNPANFPAGVPDDEQQ